MPCLNLSGAAGGLRTMRRIPVWAAIAALVMAAPAQAAARSITLSISAGPLGDALTAFSRQAGVGLLFDPALTAALHSPGVSGRLDLHDGLDRLLAGSGLGYRQLASGGYVIVKVAPRAAQDAGFELAGPSPTTVPELLVIGRSTVNTDIARSPDDIQPYQVATGAQIRNSQAMSVEDFLRSRLPGNAEPMALGQAPALNHGSAASAINLSGLGSDQTLILVDGRRLPSIPVFAGFLQADLNAIPPAAIERIETLTSVAGGIYGPGAIGGVLNIVLKRDYDGLELSGTAGTSDRGDARHWRLDASGGMSSPSGSTRLMVALSHGQDDGLTVGQRDFIARSRVIRDQNGVLRYPPSSPSINILGTSKLSTDSGLSLDSTLSSLPTANGLDGAGLAILAANAGRFDLNLSPDGAGALQSALPSITTNAALLDLRQSVDPRIDIFLDALYFEDKGVAAIPWFTTPLTDVPVGQNGNPFDTPIQVTFPTPGLAGSSSTDIRTERITAGAIGRLAYGWSTELDLSLARASTEVVTSSFENAQDFLVKENPNLFGGAAALQASLAAYGPPPTSRSAHENNMSDLNLRLAGPLLTTSAGPTTLTLLAETRREDDPKVSPLDPAATGSASDIITGQSERVDSAYAELRASLYPLNGPIWPLRGLQLQLAARADRFDVEVPTTSPSAATYLNGDTVVHARQRTSTLTAGFKVTPFHSVMLRTSYSTGYVPPSPSQLIPASYVEPQTDADLADDPKRPGDWFASRGSVLVRTDGSPDLGPERAVTFSAGMVVTPSWVPGLRISVDYTRTKVSEQIVSPLNGEYSDFYALEDRYPGAVKRGPLTPEDAALGYTVGPVVFVDASLRNVGSSTTEIIDIDLDDRFETRLGRIQIYGHAVWQPDLIKSTTPLASAFQTIGKIDGPLSIRGNLGANWEDERWQAGLNVQFYSGYSITYGADDLLSSLLSDGPYGVIRYQGSTSIPWQAYVDATLSYSFNVATVLRLGVKNLFGARPPVLAVPLNPQYDTLMTDQGIGYSPYGDPRGRRFELSVSRRF